MTQPLASFTLTQLSSTHLATLRLARTPGIGPHTFHKLVRRFGSAEEVITASAHWQQGALKDTLMPSADAIQREHDTLVNAGGWWLIWGTTTYPAALQDLPDAPLVLAGLGQPHAVHQRQLAIVGNRNASAHGLQFTQNLARQLVQQGVVITSGLARGIDTAAHEGALASATTACTIAVVAGGVNHIYPPENARLREQIFQRGCVLSEQPWGAAPTAPLFPRRNRIIAGLSVGVVVAEATRHSGSLITAQHALEYGRPIWAIPGSPADPRAGGPNWLLKQGAHLLESAEDILSTLPHTAPPYVPPREVYQAPLPLIATPASASTAITDDVQDATDIVSPQQRIFGLLGPTPVGFDVLVRQLGWSEAELAAQLTLLELEGHVQQSPTGGWSRRA